MNEQDWDLAMSWTLAIQLAIMWASTAIIVWLLAYVAGVTPILYRLRLVDLLIGAVTEAALITFMGYRNAMWLCAALILYGVPAAALGGLVGYLILWIWP